MNVKVMLGLGLLENAAELCIAGWLLHKGLNEKCKWKIIVGTVWMVIWVAIDFRRIVRLALIELEEDGFIDDMGNIN